MYHYLGQLTHRPDIVVGLTVVVGVTGVEVDVPGVRQVRPIGRRRPIVVRLNAGANSKHRHLVQSSGICQKTAHR